MSTTYNFTATGEGAYNFEARNLFHIVDSDKTITPLYADVETHAAKISGKLAIAKPAIQKRATFVGCSATRQTQLNAAASQAQTYAANALSYVFDCLSLSGDVLTSDSNLVTSTPTLRPLHDTLPGSAHSSLLVTTRSCPTSQASAATRSLHIRSIALAQTLGLTHLSTPASECHGACADKLSF